MQESNTNARLHQGKVVAIRSSVVDIYFEEKLPALYSQLRGGEQGEICIEVANHLDDRTVRGICITPISGLARGSWVLYLGQSLPKD